MDRDSFESTIRAFKRRNPFMPFTVALVDGNRFEIDYSDALAIRDGLASFLAPGRVPVFFDADAVSQIIGDLAGKK